MSECRHCHKQFEETNNKIGACPDCFDYFVELKRMAEEENAILDERYDNFIKTYFRKCKQCDEYFVAKNTNQLFCNKTCRKIQRDTPEWRKLQSERVKNWYKTKTQGKTKLRFEIFKRDNFKCVYCGRPSHEGGVILEIVFRNPQGSDTPDNLATCCRDCKCGKDAILLDVH